MGKIGVIVFKHCSGIVWHWETDKCGGKKQVIDNQFSLPGSANSPTQDTTNSTYTNDRNAFNNPQPVDGNFPVPPPAGVSQSDFDIAVTQSGSSYVQGDYRLLGPNSNTAASNIIRGAGGTPPNVLGAFGQNSPAFRIPHSAFRHR